MRVKKRYRVQSEQMVMWRKSRWAVTAACRQYKSEFWDSLSTSLNFMFERNDMNSFFSAVKRTYGVAKKGSSPGSTGLLSAGGDLLYTTPAQVLARWREHFYALLNQQGQADHDRAAREFFPEQRPLVESLRALFTILELQTALDDVQCAKATGADKIPNEV